MNYRLGRLPCAYRPGVPRLSALLAGQALPPPPAAVDHTFGLPADLGMMLNNRLGDCTCAAWGHAVQVWTYNGQSHMRTPPDADVETLYERACGYAPGDPNTDQGGVEQDVLTYLVNTGVSGEKLAAFVEVDVRNLDDVKRAIAWCGVAYIGFDVPAYLMADAAWITQGGVSVAGLTLTQLEQQMQALNAPQ